LNAGVQNWSVHVLHAVESPPLHSDAQCWAPHETTAPQQAAQPAVRLSFVWRHDATQVVSPEKFEVM